MTATNARIGSVVFDAANPNGNGAYRTVAADPTQAFTLDDGEFLIVSHNGYTTIGRLTGRTRRCWGIACPTIERYEVETYATVEGVILGRRGDPSVSVQ